MSHADEEFEPIPGLPHELPEGERVIWQGRPAWRALAREVFKVKWLAIYFAVFAVGRLVMAVVDGEGVGGAMEVLKVVITSLAGLGILGLMAWMQARATVYTITNRRVVMRVGVALPVAWNVPFKRIVSADMTERKDGDGDIVLTLGEKDRIGWVFLWPHVQPMRFAKARPAFRAITNPQRVATILQKAVKAWAVGSEEPIAVPPVEATSDEPRRPVRVAGPELAEASR